MPSSGPFAGAVQSLIILLFQLHGAYLPPATIDVNVLQIRRVEGTYCGGVDLENAMWLSWGDKDRNAHSGSAK